MGRKFVYTLFDDISQKGGRSVTAKEAVAKCILQLCDQQGLILISNKTMKSFYYAAKCGVSGEAAGNVVPCDLHRPRRHGVKRRNQNIFEMF